MTEIKIENNIPMPEKGGSQSSTRAKMLLAMEVGDSFLASNGTGKKMYSCYWFTKTHPDYEFATRKTADGVRAWRVK